MNKNISLLFVPVLLASGCSAVEVETTAPESSDNYTITAYVPPWKPELSPKFDSPWPTDVTREELINSSLYNTYNFFDEIRDPNCSMSYNLHLGEPIVGEAKDIAAKLADDTIGIYCNYLTEEMNIIGGNYDYAKQVMADNNYPADQWGGVCGHHDVDAFAGACAYKGSAWFPMISTVRQGEQRIEGRRLTIAIHEIFHIVHDQMDPLSLGQTFPPGHELFRPTWFIEGGGEYFGRVTASYLELYPYDKFTPTDRSGMFLDVSYLSDLELLEVLQNRAFGTENYYSGQVAMEYMIASKGVDSVFQVWLNLGQGMDFYQAFESGMGITVQEFYELFETMHSNLYEGDLVDNKN